MRAPHMMSCPAFNSRSAFCNCGARFIELAVTSDQLRALARHLHDRVGAPSLDGYDLIDGMVAAANLIDGSNGPDVHDTTSLPFQSRTSLKNIPKLPLARLLERVCRPRVRKS